MLRKVAAKVAWVGRTASAPFGLTLVLALISRSGFYGVSCQWQPILLYQGDRLSAQKLDDLQPAASVTLSATAFQGKANIAPGNTATILTLSQPRLRLTYKCPTDVSVGNGEVILKNTGTNALNVISDREGSPANVQYVLLAPGDVHSRAPEPIGDRVSFQAQAKAIATMQVFSAHRTAAGGFSTDDCHVQAQALVTS